MENNIVSFSGGKDSTAMLLMMLEKGVSIHSVVFFDTGWEFPQMYEHLDKVEDYTGIKIIRLKPKYSFTYLLCEKPVTARKGPLKGRVYRKGYGWPSFLRRWCTRLKINTFKKYTKNVENNVVCIGYAFDEIKRLNKKNTHEYRKERFPLIEWKITEREALDYCYKHGFTWGGLYEIFHRVSCFCCPLQRMGELKNTYKHFPELWNKMLEWDSKINPNRGFKGYKTVHDLDKEFRED